ncbi:MFS transporter [Noviherbaspirillum sp.]|uniref:MFS transporter n=1 Tax=Noviherbaspirillum sp. TaxID=1926288 RepID=UPI002D5F658E|nr:MFS transporter [Noviherbaspirillum sp.]HZW21741.1 MFS transporter [Noviherbaspirillum sp.]
MFELNRGRLNLLLATAAFTISSAGSVLLHIVLAMAIYARTGSGLMTSLFVSLQWVPALLVVLVRSDWDHGMDPRVRWYLLDLLAAALTLPILFFVEASGYLPVVLLLLVRGIVDHVNRINKTVAARALFPKEKATHYASFLQTGYHLGIGIAAIAGIFLAGRIDLHAVVLLDALTFVVAAALVYFTRCVEPIEPAPPARRPPLAHRIADYRDALAGDRRLFVCAILMPLTATFFQGSYSVLQPIFPVQKLGLGAAAVSASYVLASLAIIAGSASFSYFCKKRQPFDQPFLQTRVLVGALSLLAAGLYVGAVWTDSALASAAAYTLMIVVFEFIWMTGYGGTVAYAPKGQLGSVFGISFAIGCFLASVLAAAVGMLLDYLGNDFLRLVGLLMLLFLTIVGYAVAAGDKPAVPACSDSGPPA